MNRKIDIFLISVLSCFIIVFCILGLYNHPQSDDYSFALAVKQFGFFNAQQYWFSHWSGRFFVNCLASLQPILVNLWVIYKILPSIFILYLIISVYLFIKPYLQVENNNMTSVLFALSIIVIWLSHNPALAESLFWYTGFVNYIFPIPFALFLVSILFKYEAKWTMPQIVYSIISILILAGSSELYLIFDVFWILLWLILKTSRKSFTLVDVIFFLEILLLVCFVLISEGNNHRSSIVNTYQNPIGVISYSFFYSLRFLIYEIESGSLILFMLLSFPLFNFSFVRSALSKYRVWFFAYFLLFIWVSIAFVVWFTGDKVPARFLSALHLIVIIAIPLFIYSLIDEKWLLKIQNFVSNKPLKWGFYILFMMALFLPDRGTIKFNHPMNGNLFESTKIILNGDAKSFDLEMTKRTEILRNSKNSSCIVPTMQYSNKLCYMDLSADTANWFNVKVAGFFNLKSVKTDNKNFDSSESQKVQY